jgi:hypothetical protein
VNRFEGSGRSGTDPRCFSMVAATQWRGIGDEGAEQCGVTLVLVEEETVATLGRRWLSMVRCPS